MSDFRIGGFPPRPAPGITGGKKAGAKETASAGTAGAKSAFDTASVNPNRLAVMPRMSAIGSGGAQHVKGETVESMLRDNAPALDDYFSQAYGFKD